MSSSFVDDCINAAADPFPVAAGAGAATTTAEPNTGSGKVFEKPLRYSPSSSSLSSLLCRPPSSFNSQWHNASPPNIYGGLAKIGDDSSRSSDRAESPQVRLSYTVHDFSSYCGTYHPNSIRENKPAEQSSRWSSGTHDQAQFVMLRLDKPVVACAITFGKFHRAHVCNLREFKVYGGMDTDDMVELLHTGLQNNTEPESFSLLYALRNLIFPVQYIKIVPLATFGPNFNYSIWFVGLKGHSDERTMNQVMYEYQNYREMETIRLCLKHFRQRNMMDIFYLIQDRTGVELENSFLTQLHKHLVQDADFTAAEQVLEAAHARHIFKDYAANAEYTPIWKRIWATNEDGDAPCGRGGHQMCIDVEEEKIYLFGGWNGYCDLSDLWCYHIREGRWRLLSADTRDQGGPGPRSCHKMCFDPDTKSIFVLGQFVEPSAILTTNLDSDFFRYFVEYDQWVKISDNTARDGGPELIYDHQICIDSKTSELYVFGGRVAFVDPNGHNYGGLYSYHIPTNTWQLIRIFLSSGPQNAMNFNRFDDNSRVGHSMLFNPCTRGLYIFAGQRVKDYLADLYCYTIDNDHLVELAPEHSKSFGPRAGFTQRATIDPTAQEIHVFSGYRVRQGSDTIVSEFWVYNIEQNQWKNVYQTDKRCDENGKSERPCPRYAHDMVYNPVTKTQYIFGGNPGEQRQPQLGASIENGCKRLSDFWALQLTKPDPAGVFRKCLLMLRMQRLEELCKLANRRRMVPGNVCDETLQALEYLQSQVAVLVDHNIEEESNQFHQLCAKLCLLPPVPPSSSSPLSSSEITASNEDESFEERTQLFEKILDYLPTEMKEPSGQLLDAVKFV
ncbi:Muskelin N-terminus-domain-containing protein [Zychaea mexicana]|uniref:Muskelin N-terminus-domain-containing protein n=1 Tax=Zychaea mexicana TaxID=64656 RepID=UPI0022FDD43C|nr:Muskelin N-terminus-domain-containing protein [Zychaea mexicana]KAI9497069.1 Muskelin N-terminus-domain-containing protein [Zychaea mexicana]